MAYLVAAFSWWAILLSQKNTEIYNLKNEHLVEKGLIDSSEIEREYNVSKKMVLGEALVFALSILIGLLLINRAFWSELTLNKRLNNFLLSVTHELKTPITSLNLINRTLATKTIDEDKQKELLDTSYEESIRLESLVNNILTAAQMESNYKFNFEKVDLNLLIEQRISRLKKIHPNLEIDLNLSHNLRKLNADKESIIKLLDNLLDNAIKYSSETKWIGITTINESKNIILSVSDKGIGIEESELAKVLDKFYRIGSEEVRQTKGTGLGLFIVKEIVDAHKAKMIISKNSPKGTIFKLVFP